SSFGNSATNIGGFGSSVSNLGGFGGSVQVSGGFNQVQTTLLANVNLSAGTNTYIQTIDTNAAQVLTSAIQTIQQHFGGSIGNSRPASGGFNQIQSSRMTSYNVGGGNNTYLQPLDANSAQVLESAISSVGASTGNNGGFGGSVNNLGGFGNSVSSGGGFNKIR